MGFENHELDYRTGGEDKDQLQRLGQRVCDATRQSNQCRPGAAHKCIDKIENDSTSQRANSIRMTDGRLVTFIYDVKGERSVKSVLGSGQDRSLQEHLLLGDPLRAE